MTITTWTIWERKDCWEIWGGPAAGIYRTAAEAERAAREAAPLGVLTLDWIPETDIGRRVVEAIVTTKEGPNG